MHTLSSQPDLPSSSKESAETGHTPTQAPHPMQVSLSTVTGIMFLLRYDYSTPVFLEQLTCEKIKIVSNI